MRHFFATLLSIAMAFVSLATAQADAPAAKGKLRVLLTYGGHGFEEKPFFAMFDAMTDLQVTKAPMPQSAKLFKPAWRKTSTSS